MPRSASEELLQHMQGEVTTLATCWRLERTDGAVMGFTSHPEDIIFEAVAYAAETGFYPTDTEHRADMSTDNAEAQGFLDSSAITEEDIEAGLYDGARIECFVVNYVDLSQGKMILQTGFIGRITRSGEAFTAEMRGLAQKLQKNIGRVYGETCDAILGDARCGVSLGAFTFAATVTAVVGRRRFSASALTQEADYFAGGEVEWTGGANNGLRTEVAEFLDGQITLVLPMPYDVEVGDNFTAVAGCPKTADICKSRFANLVNFRGFPSLPGNDKILETAGTAG